MRKWFSLSSKSYPVFSWSLSLSEEEWSVYFIFVGSLRALFIDENKGGNTFVLTNKAPF
jgi:hypothetical protein